VNETKAGRGREGDAEAAARIIARERMLCFHTDPGGIDGRSFGWLCVVRLLTEVAPDWIDIETPSNTGLEKVLVKIRSLALPLAPERQQS
jgi:hypothetical protein